MPKRTTTGGDKGRGRFAPGLSLRTKLELGYSCYTRRKLSDGGRGDTSSEKTIEGDSTSGGGINYIVLLGN